jgi:hypothetical protein
VVYAVSALILVVMVAVISTTVNKANKFGRGLKMVAVLTLAARRLLGC